MATNLEILQQSRVAIDQYITALTDQNMKDTSEFFKELLDKVDEAIENLEEGKEIQCVSLIKQLHHGGENMPTSTEYELLLVLIANIAGTGAITFGDAMEKFIKSVESDLDNLNEPLPPNWPPQYQVC